MPYMPALARLRRSTAFGVLGLAAIAIAGCSEPHLEAEPIHYETVYAYAQIDCGDPCRIARSALDDGFLTVGEYDTVMAAAEEARQAKYRQTMGRIKAEGK